MNSKSGCAQRKTSTVRVRACMESVLREVERISEKWVFKRESESERLKSSKSAEEELICVGQGDAEVK